MEEWRSGPPAGLPFRAGECLRGTLCGGVVPAGLGGWMALAQEVAGDGVPPGLVMLSHGCVLPPVDVTACVSG